MKRFLIALLFLVAGGVSGKYAGRWYYAKHEVPAAVPTRPVTFSEMVKAGHYDLVDREISASRKTVDPENFTADGLLLVRFAHSVSTEMVLMSMIRDGLRPATNEELLAFGAEKPEEQKKYPVVALSQFLQDPNGEGFALCLDWDGNSRVLVLFSLDYEWNESYRFLASRVKPASGFVKPP